MKAAVLYEHKTPLKMEELNLNDPGHGDVLVELRASGVCHSDWHVVKGDWTQVALPVILGHEGAGVVTETGPDVTNLQAGDHVILSWKTSCGLCEMCQKGWPNLCYSSPEPSRKPTLCSNGEEMNRFINLGTFATHTVVPEEAAVQIDRDIPFAQASLIGCGVMTGVGAVINTARVEPGTSVAVFGCGGVGLNCIQGADLAGATVIIGVDLSDFKLDLARQFGATHTVNAGKENAVDRILELTGGLGVHYAFEAIGMHAEPFVQSIRCTRRRGTTVWVGHAPIDTPVTIDARDLLFEKTVIGSMYGSARPHIDFPRLLNLYKAGRLRLDELISREFKLEEVNDAFEVLGKGEVARSVLILD